MIFASFFDAPYKKCVIFPLGSLNCLLNSGALIMI